MLRTILWLKYKIKDNEVFEKAYKYVEMYYTPDNGGRRFKQKRSTSMKNPVGLQIRSTRQ